MKRQKMNGEGEPGAQGLIQDIGRRTHLFVGHHFTRDKRHGQRPN